MFRFRLQRTDGSPADPPELHTAVGSWRRARVHERDGVCVRCGSTRRLHVHHRVPLRYGGSHDISNLELLCARCHGQ